MSDNKNYTINRTNIESMKDMLRSSDPADNNLFINMLRSAHKEQTIDPAVLDELLNEFWM